MQSNDARGKLPRASLLVESSRRRRKREIEPRISRIHHEQGLKLLLRGGLRSSGAGSCRLRGGRIKWRFVQHYRGRAFMKATAMSALPTRTQPPMAIERRCALSNPRRISHRPKMAMKIAAATTTADALLPERPFAEASSKRIGSSVGCICECRIVSRASFQLLSC